MSKRAERRYHELRMRNHARTVFPDMPEKWIHRISNNLAICSRFCCGNPRRHFKSITQQENRANDDFEDYLNEYKVYCL